MLTETFAWQDRRIAWGRAGSGPAVVFCHGTPWSSVLWQPFAASLSSEFSVYVWDMPGYGRSSMDAGHPVDFGVQAEAFAALLTHWGLQRPHVVAHDLGGVVSLTTHLTHGVQFASLFLADVVAIPPAGSPFYRYVQQHADVLAKLPPYIHEAVVRAYISGASHRELRADDLDALAAPWLTTDGQQAFYRQIAQFDGTYLERIEQSLGELDLPVSVVWGERDTWIPPAVGERLADGIRGAQLTRVPDAGHLIHLDAPAALATALRGWLARVP